MSSSPCPLAERQDVPTPLKFVAQCDREHHVLKQLYDDIVVAKNQCFRKTSTAKILHILTMYVKFHFNNEHLFMAAVGYPDCEYHDHIHHEFIEKLQVIRKDYASGGDAYEAIRDIYYGLANGHIPETDSKLLEFAQELASSCPHTTCHRCRA